MCISGRHDGRVAVDDALRSAAEVSGAGRDPLSGGLEDGRGAVLVPERWEDGGSRRGVLAGQAVAGQSPG